jgi:membrane protein implicated in regulation of membrane protease activity
MTWSDFYLICFAVGFLFSLLSFIAGGLNVHGHWPHVHFHSGGAHGAGAHGPAGAGTTGHGHNSTSVSPFNFFTIAVFLAWFGGTGYLLTRFSTLVFALGLAISTAVGLLGAGIVFTFLARVLMAPEALMDPADYEMVGVIGRVAGAIREEGTGEIIYSQKGSRRACAARSEDKAPIERDAEVVVTRYERGIAYIRRWDEVHGE